MSTPARPAPARGPMGGGRGPMAGMMPGGKAQDFGPSAKRLLGTLRPDAAKLVAVLVLGILSVALSVAGPKILGEGTNIIFAGFVSLQVPAGATKQQIIDQLVASGNQQQADMLSAMSFTPGAGIDMDALRTVILLVLAVYLFAALFG